MLRNVLKILGVASLVVTGSIAVMVYRDHSATARQLVRLEQEKQALQHVVERLSDERRVAELIVTEQKPGSGGEPLTTLLFVEYTKAGKSLPPRTFTIEGNVAHVDAMVIKFDRHFVAEGDPLRGRSIALFTRIYGDRQSPASAAPVDIPDTVPEIYRDADPQVTDLEHGLWQQFWRLTSDEQFRRERGVRVAMGQGVWGMFEPARLYTIALESDGGLSLTSEPMKGIYREALRLSGAEADPLTK